MTDICVICQEDLCGNIYELPECGHKYHTNCIVTWFRNGSNRCPLCGNKGINNNESTHNNARHNRHWYYYRYQGNDKVTILRNYLKNHKSPVILEKAFAKLKKLQGKENQ